MSRDTPVIERATALDLDAIVEIERHSFTTAWTTDTFAAELAKPHARIVVARDADRVSGFCNYWIVPTAELHVLSIATHPDHRRRGVGAALLAYSLDEARRSGSVLATLEVRRANRPAVALYERHGFRTVHVRTGYYQADGEDALVMLCDLAMHP